MLKYLVYSFFFLFAFTSLSGQFQLGNRLDAYAGINGAFLQPAATVSTPYSWDLNLVNVGLYFANDYGYVANASALGILNDARKSLTADVREETQSWVLGDRVYAYDYYNLEKPHFAAFEADILGPSFSLQLGEWTRIGLFTRLRAATGARSIDADFSYYPYDERADGTSFQLDKTFAAAAIWSEYGVHFSRAFETSNDSELRLGTNLRYLLPIDGAYIFNPGGTTYGKINVDSISLTGSSTEIAFSNGVRGTEDPGTTAGSGYGIDFGLQFAWEVMPEGGYRYSAGVSVLDVGTLNFNKTSELHRFGSERTVFISAPEFQFIDERQDIDAALDVLSQQFYGGGGVSKEADNFKVGLPTALSAQFTYRPLSDLRISAAYAGGISLNDRQLRAGQQLTLAAHFSRWWYGAGLTTSLHEWSNFNLGFQLRLGPLTFGTDRLFGTLAKARQFQAADFYIGLKFHNFGINSGNDRKGQFQRSKNSRKVKCYQF